MAPTSVLGGGLPPGTLTVLVGLDRHRATANSACNSRAPGWKQERNARHHYSIWTRGGDSQNHANYKRPANVRLESDDKADPDAHVELSQFFATDRPREECLHIFNSRGRRVTRNDMDADAWHDWQGPNSPGG